jgi:hypothetical protein
VAREIGEEPLLARPWTSRRPFLPGPSPAPSWTTSLTARLGRETFHAGETAADALDLLGQTLLAFFDLLRGRAAPSCRIRPWVQRLLGRRHGPTT